MLYTEKCPKCGAVQEGLDLKETEGTYICSNCKAEVKVYKENLIANSFEEKQLKLLESLLTDDTRWDLMTEKELERRLKVYEKTKDGEDLIKTLSCLRLASVYYLKADKDSNNVIITSTDEGDYLPVYSSKRRIGKEEKQKYYGQEVRFEELCQFVKDEKRFVGFILNCNSNRLVIEFEHLLQLMDSIDRLLVHIDDALEEGIDEQDLTEIMFERFGGRNVHVDLKNGNAIDGEVWSSHLDDGEVCLDVTSDGKEYQVYRKEVKTIKAYPIE